MHNWQGREWFQVHDYKPKIDIPNPNRKTQIQELVWTVAIESLFEYMEVRKCKKVKLVTIKMKGYAFFRTEQLHVQLYMKKPTEKVIGHRFELNRKTQIKEPLSWTVVVEMLLKYMEVPSGQNSSICSGTWKSPKKKVIVHRFQALWSEVPFQWLWYCPLPKIHQLEVRYPSMKKDAGQFCMLSSWNDWLESIFGHLVCHLAKWTYSILSFSFYDIGPWLKLSN